MRSFLRLNGLDSHSLSHAICPRMLALPLVCCVLVAATAAHGEVYKWVDDSGVMHYTSAPPEKSIKAFKRMDRVALSVPEARVPKSVSPPAPQPAVQDFSSKVDSLERHVTTERQARLAAE